MTSTPPTEQQLDEIEAVVNAASQIGADIDPGTARILAAEVRRLRAELATACGQAIVWAADAVDAKLTAEPDHNRASALYELLLHLRGELPCTCARSGGLHAKGCRRYVPGHEQISRQNQLDVYRAAAVAPDAASEATSAPLRPSQPSSVSESAQSPTGTPEGRLGDLPSTEDLAAADNPTHLRWGLGDVLRSDDGSVIVMLSGPDREAYWLELDPERAAVLREDLAGPDGAPSPERDTLIAELLPAWEAMYEPGNVSTYLIGYANSEAGAKGAAEAWMRSQAEVTGRLEWEQWNDAATLPDGYDALFELIQRHDDGIDTGPGIAVRCRIQPTAIEEQQ